MRYLRGLLLPFSWIYGSIMALRNKLFDLGIWESYPIKQKSIVVGNISVAGTGKTPHIIFLNDYLNKNHPTAIVSRGYGRKTKGLVVADENSTTKSIGDEPMTYLKRFPKTPILLAEKRKEAIIYLEKNQNTETIILLDDAFQHRWVKAGMYIALTQYSTPYFKDFVLPAGRLREFRSGIKRANLVVVTKCPEHITDKEKEEFYQKIPLLRDCIFFSHFHYSPLVNLENESYTKPFSKILLVTGIENPKPLMDHLKQIAEVKHLSFPDHHQFTKQNLEEIYQIFFNFARENAVIVTTEKDAVRLQDFQNKGLLKDFPWTIQKVEVQIQNEEVFYKKLNSYVRNI
jgi:tetraacyldisaccharide 4'-kinase